MPNNSKISFRLDEERQKGLEARCEEMECTPSDYLRGLIDVDLEEVQEAAEQERQKAAVADHQTYYLHKSNPNIKLIETVKEHDRIYYLDTEGRKWLMNADMTLIPVVRLYV